MNKKLLMFTLMPLVLLMTVTSAMAKPIGPQKAVGKNPHIMPTAEGVELLPPSGGMHSWTNDTEFWYMDLVHGLDASKAKIPNAFPLTMEDLTELMTNETAALETENKWGYMSNELLVEMITMELIMEGVPPEEAAEIAEEMAAMWPEGMYVRYVNVGK